MGAAPPLAYFLTAPLLGCGPQQATAPGVDLGHINPALSTDPLAILFDPLRAEMSQSFPPGTNLAPGYAPLVVGGLQKRRPGVPQGRPEPLVWGRSGLGHLVGWH